LLHPCIVDAAVVGLRQTTKSYDSELPRAYVVLGLGAILTDTQVRTFIEKRLAKFKALSGGVSFVACIPRNGSGKILRRLLLQQDPTVLDI
jgi:acyl-coenzyme A synthetase/AMP-(fatty) acid ligase